MSPQPGLALFQGTPGTVTLDDSAGNINITGMQFAVDGYTLTGDALTLFSSNGNPVTIDVGDGGSGGAGYKATINNVLIGGAGLTKSGAGTLVLAAANAYTGETDIKAGTLALVANGSIADSKAVGISNGSTLDISGATNGASIRGLYGEGSIVLGNKNLVMRGDSSFDGVISGAGGLEVSSGYTTLAGVNTYTGLTTIDHGADLQLGNGNVGSVAGDILDNGWMSFSFDDADLTYGGVISGSGSVDKTGAGTLTLTGANTFTGGIMVTGVAGDSVLAVSSDANLGAPSGYVDLQGGTLEATASFTLNHQLDLVTNSARGPDTVQVDSGATLTVAKGIAGGASDNLIKTGPGTLVLAAINGYGGSTAINEGTLALTGAGSLANSSDVRVDGTFDISGAPSGSDIQSLSGMGSVTLGTRVLLLSNASGNFGGVISGSGALTISGGTEIFSGANTYTGGTTISGGTLQIGNGSTSGSIVGNVMNDGSLVFDRSDTVNYGGVISGTGSLTQAGTGTLTLTDTSTYGGSTTVSAGTLQIGNGGTGGSIIGDVINNGSLVFDRSDAVNYSGVISGTGSVTQAGTGTLTLIGANTYSGGTNINGGVLRVSSDANLGSLPVVGGTSDVVTIDNGTFQAGGSFTLSHEIDIKNTAYIDTNGYALILAGTVNGADSRQGTLVKEGAGTLTITAGSTEVPDYKLTKVDAGTLAVSGEVYLNNQDLSVASGATFDVSQLSAPSAVSTLSGNGTVAVGNSVLNIDGGAPWAFGGVITDGGIGGGSGGGLLLQPDVTGTLTGVNTYTGETIISSGTLALAGNGSIADSSLVSLNYSGGTFDISGTTSGATVKAISGIGSVVLGGKTLTVSNASSDVTGAFDGAISGTGGLVLSGGTLWLAGENTYSGGTTIDAGAALWVGYGEGGGSIVGNVVDNGLLVFSGEFDATYGGVISGTGSVTRDGAFGTLTLTGANTYTGGTTINDGILHATAKLPGDVTVIAGGMLDGGPGVAGNLSNAGKVAIHDGDTTAGENYTNSSTGTLAVSLGSKLVVTGKATLNGGTLEITGTDSGYSHNAHTDVLTAVGGVSGTFTNLVVDSGTAFTDETIHYGANDVYLDTTGLSITVAAKAMGIVEPAAVSAAQRVQDGFETINATTASAGTVAPDVLQGAGDIQHSATPAVVRATLTSLSGQLHAASAAMLFDGIDARSDALAGHFDDLLSGRAASGIWYGNLGWQGNLQRSGYAGATFRSDGGMAGADMRFGGHALLGVAVGQSRGFGQLDAAWDHDRTWMSNIAAYGGLMNGPWYASAQVASGWYREDMQRLLQLSALGAPVGTRSTGRYVAGSLEGGRLFHIGGTRVVPFANVRYQRLTLGGFTEQGGLGYGLKANAHGTSRLQAGLGLRAAHGWRLADGMRMEFDGSVGWRHTLHQYGSAFDASFTGFDNWLPVEGIGLSRNTAVLRAGLSLWPTRNVGLRIGYMREQDQRERAGSAMLQGTVAF